MIKLHSQALIDQFVVLKNQPIKDTNNWQNSSEQVQRISSLIHKFYKNEVRQLGSYTFLNELIQLAMTQLDLGHNINLNAKLELQYHDLKSLITIHLYTPSQVVAMIQTGLSENEQQLLELFIAQADTWLLVNLGLHLQSLKI